METLPFEEMEDPKSLKVKGPRKINFRFRFDMFIDRERGWYHFVSQPCAGDILSGVCRGRGPMQLNSLQSMHSHGHQPAFFMGFGAKSFGSDFPLEVLPRVEVYSLVTVDAKVQLCIGCEL